MTISKSRHPALKGDRWVAPIAQPDTTPVQVESCGHEVRESARREEIQREETEAGPRVTLAALSESRYLTPAGLDQTKGTR